MTYNKEKWFKREQISLKIPCRVHPIERIRPILKQKGFIDSNVLSKLRSNIKVKIGGTGNFSTYTSNPKWYRSDVCYFRR